jgi:hypothetical protein
MLDFPEESAKEPFTADERLAYGIVDSLTLEEIPLPERKASAYSMAWHDRGLSRPSRLVGQKRTIDDIKSYFVS